MVVVGKALILDTLERLAAGVPNSLMSSTVKAATLIAAGQAMVAGVVPAKVAALMEAVVKCMMLTKLSKVAAAGLVVLCLCGLGIGGFLALPAQDTKTTITTTTTTAITKQSKSDPLPASTNVIYLSTSGEKGEQVRRLPFLGNETVASVIHAENLTAAAAEGRVFVTRFTSISSFEVLKVDWQATAQKNQSATDHKLQSGDHLYVEPSGLGKPGTTPPCIQGSWVLTATEIFEKKRPGVYSPAPAGKRYTIDIRFPPDSYLSLNGDTLEINYKCVVAAGPELHISRFFQRQKAGQ